MSEPKATRGNGDGARQEEVEALLREGGEEDRVLAGVQKPLEIGEQRLRVLLHCCKGKVERLTSDFEERAFVVASPDKTRYAIGGASPSVVSDAGEQQHEWELPPDQRVAEVVWSPDGKSFAYIQGPSSFYRGVP